MRNVPGHPDLRMLTRPLLVKNMDGSEDFIQPGFEWNGNSTPFGFRWLVPRHDHPIASCRHDYRCRKAKNKAERYFADKEYRKDINTTAGDFETWAAYKGVRVGAFFGMGNGF